jgi:hypothetical protein
MRFSYKDTPIQFKLMMMVLVVGTVTFFITSGLIAIFTRSTFQDKIRDDMAAITRILGDNCVIPIQNKNELDAREGFHQVCLCLYE